MAFALYALTSWHSINYQILVATVPSISLIEFLYSFYRRRPGPLLPDAGIFRNRRRQNCCIVCVGDFNAITRTTDTNPKVIGPSRRGSPMTTRILINFCSGSNLGVCSVHDFNARISNLFESDLLKYQLNNRFEWHFIEEIGHILVNQRRRPVTIMSMYTYLKFTFDSDNRAILQSWRSFSIRSSPASRIGTPS